MRKLKREPIQLGIDDMREVSRTTLQSAADPPIAITSQLSLNEAHKLPWLPQYRATLPRVSDQAIRLAARLSAALAADCRVVLFMSLKPDHATAKIVSEVSLAMECASAGPVLLMNTDLNQKGPEPMNVERTAGLAEILDGTQTLSSVLRTIADTGVSYIGRGLRAYTNSQMLKPALTVLLQLLRSDFAHILLSGPALTQADAPLLASAADAVVLCVKSGQHRRRELLSAKAELDALKTNLLGVVIVE